MREKGKVMDRRHLRILKYANYIHGGGRMNGKSLVIRSYNLSIDWFHVVSCFLFVSYKYQELLYRDTDTHNEQKTLTEEKTDTSFAKRGGRSDGAHGRWKVMERRQMEAMTGRVDERGRKTKRKKW